MLICGNCRERWWKFLVGPSCGNQHLHHLSLNGIALSSKGNIALVGCLVLSALFHWVAWGQDVAPASFGSGASCATPLINDEKLIREAWTRTRIQSPGIEEAVRQSNFKLRKGSQELKVADQNLFWVLNIQNMQSLRFDTVRAELKALGNISYVWVALQEMANGHVTMSEVNAILTALESSTPSSSLDSTKGILQIDRQVYGNPPNVNSSFEKGKGDGKTHFLICDIQDGWSGTGGYVIGFFYSVDVDPASGGVSTSNRRDLLYIDSYPGIYFNGKRRTRDALATLSHEFQHLIHWNYDPLEITFFNEGLSEYAEFLCGYGLRSSAGYLANTNVALTSWNSSLDDYSRAALWTRYTAEQYGLTFVTNLTQHRSTGIQGFELALGQSGFSKTFATTLSNFFTANWVVSGAADSAFCYKGPLTARPTLKASHDDPNVTRTDTLRQQAAQYVAFSDAKDFKITFTLPAGVSVRAVESGPSLPRIRDVPGGMEFRSPELGSLYTWVVFVVMNTQPVTTGVYSYTASGELVRFVAEEKYDDGLPDAYSQYAPYIGFGNSSPTRGMAVRFQPAVKGNVLRRARLFVAFNQEFANGTALPTDDRDFNLHVWGDNNGRPGADLIPPFLAKVDRTRFPLGSFVDVDLIPYSSSLTNLQGPIYVGFMEDDDDSVGTYAAVDNSTPDDYSYVYRGPTHRDFPNTWQTLTEVSAYNKNAFDGYNLMIRAVFEYIDSSAAPKLAVGFLQNPILSEFIDVVAASSEELRAGSLSGTLTQSSGATPLRFYSIPGTAKAFIDTSQQLKGSGTVSIRVRAANRYGVFYSDTLAAFNARLLKRQESATISTPSGELSVAFDVGSVREALYVTACDGISDPALKSERTESALAIFSLGPMGEELQRPATVRVQKPASEDRLTLAIYREGKWLALPTTFDPGKGVLTGTMTRLGIYGVVRMSDVDGELEAVPTQFTLYQNYPNPFNPATTIRYDVPRASRIRLSVYDLLGREIAVLVDEERLPGRYSVGFEAGNLSTGVYFYRLSTPELSQVKKLVVVR